MEAIETIIENICTACNISEADAQMELDSALRNLRELEDCDDLRYSDFEDACTGLGLDLDHVNYFINALSC